MKIRTGFITNSSSTNFLIISKDELTREYLFEKLGFKKGSPIEWLGWELCDDIMSNAKEDDMEYYDIDSFNYDSIKELFGEKAASILNQKKGLHIYMGRTSDDESLFTVFFTLDSFEIDESDFYLNGRDCVY